MYIYIYIPLRTHDLYWFMVNHAWSTIVIISVYLITIVQDLRKPLEPSQVDEGWLLCLGFIPHGLAEKYFPDAGDDITWSNSMEWRQWNIYQNSPVMLMEKNTLFSVDVPWNQSIDEPIIWIANELHHPIRVTLGIVYHWIYHITVHFMMIQGCMDRCFPWLWSIWPPANSIMVRWKFRRMLD